MRTNGTPADSQDESLMASRFEADLLLWDRSSSSTATIGSSDDDSQMMKSKCLAEMRLNAFCHVDLSFPFLGASTSATRTFARTVP